MLAVASGAVATSGDAEQYLELEGKRYSHIIDPRTGQALQVRTNVTVVAKEAWLADALASAVSVMGPCEGMRLIKRWPDVEMLFFSVSQDGEVQRTEAAGFRRFVQSK